MERNARLRWEIVGPDGPRGYVIELGVNGLSRVCLLDLDRRPWTVASVAPDLRKYCTSKAQ